MALSIKTCVKADVSRKANDDEDSLDESKDKDKVDLEKANPEIQEAIMDPEPKATSNETNELAQDIYRKIREWYKDGELYQY